MLTSDNLGGKNRVRMGMADVNERAVSVVSLLRTEAQQSSIVNTDRIPM